MKRKRIVICTIVGVTGIVLMTCASVALFGHKRPLTSQVPPALAEPNGVTESNIPSRDVSREISIMQQWVSRIDFPKDTQTSARIPDAVELVGQLWQEGQGLINSGKVKVKHWQGTNIASAVWKSPNKKTDIILVLRSPERRISQCRKKIYAPDGKPEQFYVLTFRDDFTGIEWCELNNQETLGFYPGNKLSRYSRRVEPIEVGSEGWYTVEWDENGKIVREQTGTYEIPKLQRFPNPKGTAR